MALSEDAQKMRDQRNAQIRAELGERSALDDLISSVLSNFAYRYIETNETGPLKASYRENSVIGIEAVETSMVNALKTQNTELRTGLIDLARTFTKKDRPFVKYYLLCEFKDWRDSGKGEILVTAKADWGFPDFNDSSKKMKIEKKLKFDDPLDVRNKLPLIFEEVCTLF